jgi:hypothetical protein
VDDATTVRALLDAAGLDPPEADVAVLVESYPLTRQLVSLLFTVDEAREEPPA